MGTGTIKLCFLAVVQHMPTVLGVVARADHLARGKKKKKMIVDRVNSPVSPSSQFLAVYFNNSPQQ